MGHAIQKLTTFVPPQVEATFATCDLEETARYVTESSLHTLRPFDSCSGVDLTHWRYTLENTNVDIVKLTCGSEFRVNRTREANHYLFQLPISGVCNIESDRANRVALPGEVFVLNPRQEASKRWKGPCVQVQVQVDRHAMERLLWAELGQNCSDPLTFDSAVQSEAAGRTLYAVTLSVWRDLSEHPMLRQWRVVRSLERNLMMTYLGLLKHNYSDEFHRAATPAAPYYVKRAEEFLRSNVRNPIDIEELVRVTKVSSRSIYYGFRRWRGTTPMNYLRNLRLSLAHEELKKARDEGNNVTRIALGVGYDHLSRFSADYKQRYGQSPSTTMLQSG